MKKIILTLIVIVPFHPALAKPVTEQIQTKTVQKATTQCSGKSCTEKKDYFDCSQCCAQGRWASDECLQRCGTCRGYNDEAFHEYRDFPNNF